MSDIDYMNKFHANWNSKWMNIEEVFSYSKAIEAFEKGLRYLDSQKESNPTELLVLTNLYNSTAKKIEDPQLSK